MNINDESPATQPGPTSFSGNRWTCQGVRLLETTLVLVPIPLCMLIAQETNLDFIALLGVPASLGLAWCALTLRGDSWANLGMRPPTYIRRTVLIAALATVGLVIAINALGTALAQLTGEKVNTERFAVLRGNVAALLAGLVIVWTTAAFGEELLARGYLLNALHDLVQGSRRSVRLAWVTALLLTSALFGLAHAYQGMAGVILTGLVGLAFGLLYLATGRNLWAPILTHGMFDTIGFVVVFLGLDIRFWE